MQIVRLLLTAMEVVRAQLQRAGIKLEGALNVPPAIAEATFVKR